MQREKFLSRLPHVQSRKKNVTAKSILSYINLKTAAVSISGNQTTSCSAQKNDSYAVTGLSSI